MNINQLSPDDRALLALYSEHDKRSGEAFADIDCSELVPNWRQIAEAEIARARKRGGIPAKETES
jgi:hypothetical protein